MDGWVEEFDTEMRGRFVYMQEEIYPVGTLDARGGIHTPEHFPCTMRRFWSLKDSSQSKHPKNNIKILRLTLHTVNRLIQLIRFYKIQGYEEWGTDTGRSIESRNRTSSVGGGVGISIRRNTKVYGTSLRFELSSNERTQ